MLETKILENSFSDVQYKIITPCGDVFLDQTCLAVYVMLEILSEPLKFPHLTNEKVEGQVFTTFSRTNGKTEFLNVILFIRHISHGLVFYQLSHTY